MKKPMKPKAVKAWAIVDNHNRIIENTEDSSRQNSWDRICNDEYPKCYWKDKGYRCIRVSIMPL